MGLANYYRYFIPGFATKVAPLTDLVKGERKGNIKVCLGPEALKAFHELKEALYQGTVLHTLLTNPHYTLHTDASNMGVKAVLAQETS